MTIKIHENQSIATNSESTRSLLGDRLQSQDSRIWKVVKHPLGAIAIIPAMILTLLLLPLFWIKRKIFPPLHVQYRQTIETKIMEGLKEAVKVSGIDKIDSPHLDQRLKDIKDFAKKVEQTSSNVSMNDIDGLTLEFEKLAADFFKHRKKNEHFGERVFFPFLKLFAKARLITDVKDATQNYGKEKLGELEVDAGQFADIWDRSLSKSSSIHKDWWFFTALWGLAYPMKTYRLLQANFDHEKHIVYNPLQGNPSYIAHDISGIPFVHLPTPSSPNGSPLFEMYLESLKDTGEKHIHFQFQSPHKADEYARIDEMNELAKRNSNFKQVVLSFDALKSKDGKALCQSFKKTGDIDQFFDDLLKQTKKPFGPDCPIFIPENLLSKEEVTQAFETAKKLFSDMKPQQTERKEFAQVMLVCLYGILMNTIIQKQEKGKTVLSGGCKECVDRGSALITLLISWPDLCNSIKANSPASTVERTNSESSLSDISNSASQSASNTLSQDTAYTMIATSLGRPSVGGRRNGLRRRAAPVIQLLKLFQNEPGFAEKFQSQPIATN